MRTKSYLFYIHSKFVGRPKAAAAAAARGGSCGRRNQGRRRISSFALILVPPSTSFSMASLCFCLSASSSLRPPPLGLSNSSISSSSFSIAPKQHLLGPRRTHHHYHHHHHHLLIASAVVAPVEAPYSREGSWDASSPTPFSLADIRAAIPKHCWVKDTWRSIGYLVRDVALVLGLAAFAATINSWILWPFYWLAQGTMFWALFVLGHDCGHGSFSDNKMLNTLIGHLIHSSILVPYHGWRISHRTHHQNHGHVENDESWHPLPETLYRSLDPISRFLRFSILALFAYPAYLWVRSPGKSGSHFDPSSSLFVPSERKDVLVSTACWGAMLMAIGCLTLFIGPIWMFKLYFMPYFINIIWLDLVTYLHHHGHEVRIPWYRGKEWSYMKGALSTIDRDYGWFNNVHHDIGTHVVHHLFPQIPHYHLIEATEAIKPVLGKYYREPIKSGPLPIHLFKPLLKSLSNDHFVSDDGDVVFYKTDYRH